MTLTDPSVSSHDVSVCLRHFVLAWERHRETTAAQLDLGTSELIALGHLYEVGAMTPTELARRLNLTSGSVTALLDRLERSGFVTRQQNPADRRSLIVMVNPAGRHAVQWAYEQLDAAVSQTLQGFPDISPERLIQFLGALSVALTELPAQ